MVGYNVERSFPVWFSATFLGLCVITLAVIVVFQTATAGHETITLNEQTCNYVETMWYDRFVPTKLKNKGPKYDRAVLPIGSTIRTIQSLYTWTIVTAATDPNDEGVQSQFWNNTIEYSGDRLNCSISQIGFLLTLQTSSMDLTANVVCINASSSLPVAWQMSTMQHISRLDSAGTAFEDTPNALRAYRTNAALDIVNVQILEAVEGLAFDYIDTSVYVSVNFSRGGLLYPVTVHGAVYPDTCTAVICPHSLPQTPQQNVVRYQSHVYPDLRYNLTNDFLNNPDQLETQPFMNMLNAFVSAVNLDLGNIASDNIFLSNQAMSNAIQPATSGIENGQSTGPFGLQGAQQLLDTVNKQGTYDGDVWRVLAYTLRSSIRHGS